MPVYKLSIPIEFSVLDDERDFVHAIFLRNIQRVRHFMIDDEKPGQTPIGLLASPYHQMRVIPEAAASFPLVQDGCHVSSGWII